MNVDWTGPIVHPGPGVDVCVPGPAGHHPVSEEAPHCPTCRCKPSAPANPDHGVWAVCGYCGRRGILPEAGHAADFLPATHRSSP